MKPPKKRHGKYPLRIYVGHGAYKWIGSYTTYAEWKQRRLEALSAAPTRGSETVQSFADRWLDDYGLEVRSGKDRWGEATKRNYRSALRIFCRDFGTTKLARFPKQQARPWAATHAESHVRVIRAMFADAKRDELVRENPFENLRLEQSKGRRDIQPLTEEEVEDLADVAQEVHPGAFGQRMRAAILTLAYVGCRPGELFALTRQDIHPSESLIDIRRSWNGVELKAPKNGRERLGLVLPPRAAEAIAELPHQLDADWTFTTKRGQQFRRFTWHLAWEPIRARFGRPRMHTYELRHTAATVLLDRGVSVEDVAWQLGHTDGGELVRTLYGHPSEDARRERLRRAFAEPTQLRAVENG